MKTILALIVFFILASVIIFGVYSSRPVLWVPPLLILVVLIGLLRARARKREDYYVQLENAYVERLRSSGERIKVEFDNCEFHESSYTAETIDDTPFMMGMVNFDFGNVVDREFVGQCFLRYQHTGGTKAEIFTQPFPCSADALKMYVLQNKVNLYVDRFDRSKYFFDLKQS